MNVLIIGNGVAGVSAAETIRASDKNCTITMFTDEQYPFYSRPRLVEYLANKATMEQITIHPESWYDKNDIRLKRSTRIDRIDPAAKLIRDSSGKEIDYDKLVIATGASCSLPPVPGLDNSNILTLRTAEDAANIKTIASGARNAVVIGGGVLGIEVAYGLSALGISVRVIEVFGRLMPRQLDCEGSAIMQRMLETKGLRFLTGRKIESIVCPDDRSMEIRLNDTSSVETDLIVVSAGIRPRLEIVENTQIMRKRAIVVDCFMRTNIPDIFACGDCAEYNGIVYGLWQPSREQGIVCGNTLLGKESTFSGTVPSVRLKVAGIELASIGTIEAKEGIEDVCEKNGQQDGYKKLFMRDGKIVGAILIGNVKEAVQLQKTIASQGYD